MRILYGYGVPITVMSEIARKVCINTPCHCSVVDDNVSVVVGLYDLDKDKLVSVVKSYYEIADNDITTYLDDHMIDHTVEYHTVADDNWNRYITYTFKFGDVGITHIYHWKERAE